MAKRKKDTPQVPPAVQNARLATFRTEAGHKLGLDEGELSGVLDAARSKAAPILDAQKTRQASRRSRAKLSPSTATPPEAPPMESTERVALPLIARVRRNDLENSAWLEAQKNQYVADDTPLSRRSIADLANLGIHGLRTHGEAITHLHATADLFGLPIGGQMRVTSPGTVTSEASRVLADTGEKGPSISGREAEILDKLTTLHTGLSTMLKPFQYAKNDEKSEEASIKKGRDPKKRPQIERQDLDTTESDEEKRASAKKQRPVKPTKAEPVASHPLHGKELMHLPGLTPPSPEGMSPSKFKREMANHNRALRERHDLLSRLSTERTARVNNVNTTDDTWNVQSLREGWGTRNRPDDLPTTPTWAGNTGRQATSEEINAIDTANANQRAREDYLKANPMARRRGWNGLLTGIPDTPWE